MAATRLELNLMRLLSRCEALAAERRDPEEWRLEKYVAALEDMLRELKLQSCKPAPELLNEYSRKVDFLKGLLEAEKLPSSSEKALANQFLAPGRTPTTTKERTPATKTVHLQTKARCTGRMRSELLGTDPLAVDDAEELNIRKRKRLAADEKQSAVELDAVLQRHQDVQEKLAEEMLSLARSLKNNTLAAQNVIKQDNQVGLVGRLGYVSMQLKLFFVGRISIRTSKSECRTLFPCPADALALSADGRPELREAQG
ncbi:vesicle transport protein USE1 isoform X2 [Columba livia]|uniref:vesicle transport protein USE1 isoform X2 n=1 Tax=Columba livia TaxID=8932 RepID=UPI0031BA743C